MAILDELVAQSINYGLIFEVILYFFAGVFLGFFINFIVNKIGSYVIYPWIRKHSVENYKSAVSSVKIFGNVIKWMVILLFSLFALSVFNIYLLEQITKLLISFVPKLGVATLIVLFGLLITAIISKKINDAEFKSHELASKLVRNILIFAIILSALELVNIRLTPLFYLFLVVISSVGLAFAIAMGLAFGFALRPKISKILSDLEKH